MINTLHNLLYKQERTHTQQETEDHFFSQLLFPSQLVIPVRLQTFTTWNLWQKHSDAFFSYKRVPRTQKLYPQFPTLKTRTESFFWLNIFSDNCAISSSRKLLSRSLQNFIQSTQCFLRCQCHKQSMQQCVWCAVVDIL